MREAIKGELFELIHGLTPDEKNYLLQFSRGGKEAKTNHVELLEAIFRQRNYNEEKLKKKFRKTAIAQQWSRIKNYLYHYILRVLQNYHRQSTELELYNNLQKVVILNDKGLYKKAYELLLETKKAAFEGVSPSFLTYIAEWEMHLSWSCLEVLGEEYLTDEQANNQWSIEIVENWLMYNEYAKRIIEQKIKGRYINMEASNLELLKAPIYASVDNAKSFSAKYLFYGSKGWLYGQTGQFLECYLESEHQFNLNKTAPLLRKQAPLGYITSLNNFAISVIENKDWDKLPSVLDAIDVFIQENNHEYIRVLLTSIKYVVLLKKCIRAREFKSGLQYKTKVEQFIANNQKQTNRYVQAHLLWHYLIQIYIINGAFDDALRAIEKVEKIQKMPIFINATLLFKLICLFEKEEILLLPHFTRSVYRNLLKKKNLYTFERIVLNLLKAAINAPSKEALKPIFYRYWSKLKLLVDTAPLGELELLEHFNYLAWMESKIKQIPLIEVLKNDEGSRFY